MNAALTHRLNRASLNVESVWRSAWDAWALDVVTEWRRVDPQVTAHFAAFERYEQEWVSGAAAEERAGFLSRGTALRQQWGLPGSVWAWFWRDVYGPVLDGDLTAWPRLLRYVPELEVAGSEGVAMWLRRLLSAVGVAR